MKHIFILSLLIFFMGCSTSPSLILFSSNESGNSDIYMMSLDGNHREKIIYTKKEEWGAVFSSPNIIQFLRQDNEVINRYEYNLITKKEKKIAQPKECNLEDKNIVFSGYGIEAYTCKGALIVKDRDASVGKNYTKALGGVSNYLAWSFDNTSIIFTNNATGNNDVYSLNVRTREITNLTNHPANDERGEISPNGKLLVFSSNRGNSSQQDLYILHIETKDIINITNSKGNDLIGRWTKDGLSIIYGSNKSENWEIYKYNLVDATTIQLTNNNAFDGDPRIR
ncbi:MAG: PD40 domain-containing protein [Flavobacteriaceae bacterium]